MTSDTTRYSLYNYQVVDKLEPTHNPNMPACMSCVHIFKADTQHKRRRRPPQKEALLATRQPRTPSLWRFTTTPRTLTRARSPLLPSAFFYSPRTSASLPRLTWITSPVPRADAPCCCTPLFPAPIDLRLARAVPCSSSSRSAWSMERPCCDGSMVVTACVVIWEVDRG